jgi:hypothetical protein
MFRLFLITVALFINSNLQAQTVPSAQTIPYTQDFAGLLSTSTTYPAGWQGWQLGTTSSCELQNYGTHGQFIVVGEQYCTYYNRWNS